MTKRERLPSISELDREQRERREQNMLTQGLENETAFQVALEVAANAMSSQPNHHSSSSSHYHRDEYDVDVDVDDLFCPKAVGIDEIHHPSNIIHDALFDMELEHNKNDRNHYPSSNNITNNSNNNIPSLRLPLREELIAPPNANNIHMEFPRLSTNNTYHMIRPPAPRLTIRPQPPPPPPSVEQDNDGNNNNDGNNHQQQQQQGMEEPLEEEERVIIPGSSNGNGELYHCDQFCDLMGSPNSNLFFLRFPKASSTESFLYIEEEDERKKNVGGDHILNEAHKERVLGVASQEDQEDCKCSATSTTCTSTTSVPIMDRLIQTETGMQQQEVQLDGLDGPATSTFVQQQLQQDDNQDLEDTMSLVASDEASQEMDDPQMPSPMSNHSSCHGTADDGSFGCLTGLNSLQALCTNYAPGTTSSTTSGGGGSSNTTSGVGLSLKKKLLIQPKPRKDSYCDMSNIVPALMESSNTSPNSSNATSRRNSATTQVTQGSSVHLPNPTSCVGTGTTGLMGGMVPSPTQDNDIRPAPSQGTTLYSNTTKSEFYELQQAFSARSVEFEEHGQGNDGTNMDDPHFLDAVSPSNLSESNFRTPTAETSRKRHRYWAGFGGGGSHNQLPSHQGEKRGRAGSIVGLFLPKLFPNSNTSTNDENGGVSFNEELHPFPSTFGTMENTITTRKQDLTHPLASPPAKHPPPPFPPLVDGPFFPSMDSTSFSHDQEEQQLPTQSSLTLSSAASFLGFMNSFSPSKSQTPRNQPITTTAHVNFKPEG